jgi:hypothetical protein
MSDSLRRIYNSIDRLFDLPAISQVLRYSRVGGDSRTPNTAQQAFHLVQPFVCQLDWQPQLKMIVSQQGLTADGASAHWEFFFSLVRRRAEVVCEWVLPWDEATDDYGQANIEIAVNPFPAVNSPIREAIREGKLLYQQMTGMWKQECRRRPTLPNKFRDTEIVLADFVRQGLDTTQVEFSLSTGKSPQGQLCWIAQTRNNTYYSPFA